MQSKLIVLLILIVILIVLVAYKIFSGLNQAKVVEKVTATFKYLESKLNDVATDVATDAENEEYGVVVCAGGFRNTEAAAGLLYLRELEFQQKIPLLPIEWFYVGDNEVTPRTRAALTELVGNIKFVDCAKLYDKPSVLKSFAIKAFALTRSRFRHALLLDSDNIPIEHPMKIFHSETYKKHGNIFWPDLFHRQQMKNTVLKDNALADFVKRIEKPGLEILLDKRETESGQIFVDRKRFAKALLFSWYLNEEKSTTYTFAYGDKDLFSIGFYMAGDMPQYFQIQDQPYSISNVNFKQEALGQRNPENASEIMFVHRTHQKRNCLSKTNPCFLLPDKGYAFMVLEISPAKANIKYSKEMLDQKIPIPLNVKTAITFVAKAEREIHTLFIK